MPSHVRLSLPANGPPGPTLHLAQHVRACEVDGQVVLLDLRRGRYLGVGAAQAQLLAALVNGWPIEPGQCGAEEAEASMDASALARKLLAQGVLSDRRSDVPIVPFEVPGATLAAEMSGISTSICATRCIRFLKAASSAYLSLRLRSLQSIATTVSNQRQRHESVPDDRALREAVAVYTRLRPLVFTVRDKCLFDSLALLEFLAAEGIHARWLIGVRTRPFTAHSWLQCGPLVLNDHHEHVRSYRPILGI